MLHAPCKECGSERIAPNVVLAGDAGGLLGRLRARVCADCGYTELRMDDAMDLFLDHERATKGGGKKAAPGHVGDPSAEVVATSNIQCPSCGSLLPAATTTCEVCGWSQGR